MYRLGKLLGYSLQEEVMLWTFIGMIFTAYEIFFPSQDHQKFLKSTINKEDASALIEKEMNITIPETIKSSSMQTLFIKYMDKFRTEELKINETIEVKKEEKNLFAIFDFYSLRVYFLTYIILVYPVCTGRNDLLATPWLVASGTRFTTPFFVYRFYMWFTVFFYWIWLLDKEIKSHRGVPAKEIKEPGEELKSEDFELRETRRRVKGIRSESIQLSLSNILDANKRDIFSTGIGILCDSQFMLPSEEVLTRRKDSIFEPNGDSTDEDETDDEKSKKPTLQRPSVKTIFTTPVKAHDCILRQLANLCFKLVEDPDEDISKKDNSDTSVVSMNCPYEIIMHYYNDFSSFLTVNEDVSFSCPKYPKPRYLTEYPAIFSKSVYGKISSQSVVSEFDNMLFRRNSVDENMLEERVKRRSFSFDSNLNSST